VNGCRISADWSYMNLRTVILENQRLRACIVPECGSKILEFVYKPSDRDFLYHNPRMELRAPVYDQHADNWWNGGIDETLPTCLGGEYNGDILPDFGELYSLPWSWDIQKDTSEEVTVHLWRKAIIAPLRIDKWLTLGRKDAALLVRHKIVNLSKSKYKFLWGIHPSFEINPHFRIDTPAGKVVIVYSKPDDRLGKPSSSYTWPYAHNKNGETEDMRLVKDSSSNTNDFQYATDLKEGWFAITDTQRKEGFGMTFSTNVFRSLYMWFVYGGYRSLSFCVVEPWTGYPPSLSEAEKSGVCSELEPGESLNSDSIMFVYDGFSRVRRIDSSGAVEGET